MKRPIKMTTTARVLVLVLFLLVRSSSFACDCKPTSSVAEALRSSQVVITGKILQANYKKKLDQTTGYRDTLSQRTEQFYFGPITVNEYTILVSRAFKGASAGDTIVLRTALDPVTDCGLLLSPRHEYIVYAQMVRQGDAFYGQDSTRFTRLPPVQELNPIRDLSLAP